MRVADVSFRKVKVQISKKKLNFNFFKIDVGPLHTAHTALHCAWTDRAHAACSKGLTSVGCFVQMAEAKFTEIQVQFFEEKLTSSFSDIGPARLHTAGGSPSTSRTFFIAVSGSVQSARGLQ